jgi:hypothetical protein
VCVDAVDLGEQPTDWGMKRQVELKFRIGDQDKADGSPMIIGRKYTQTLHADGALRKDLKSWRGQDLTAEEKANFDTEQLVGAQVIVDIEETQKTNGEPGSRVEKLRPPEKGQDVKTPEGFERAEPNPDW